MSDLDDGAGQDDLVQKIHGLEAEVSELARLLDAERENMLKEFAAGAAELAAQAELVASLRGSAEKWRLIADERGKKLEAQQKFYGGSRLMRLSERIVRRARRMRSRR